MVKGLVIPFDPERPIEVREFNRPEDYQAVVGGWIEAVDIPRLGATIYVNEEGLLRQLPFNSRASFLWWYELPERRQGAVLVGEALMVGIPDEEGKTRDIPDSTLALLTNKEHYVVMSRVGASPVWIRHPFQYEDFFEAVVWAMMLSDRVADTREVKVVKIKEFNDAQANDASHKSRDRD